jgi:uncharacterized membrane protein (Fun14 family)
VTIPFPSLCNGSKKQGESLDEKDQIRTGIDSISTHTKQLFELKNSFDFDKELEKLSNMKLDATSLTQHGVGFAYGCTSGLILKKISKFAGLIGYFVLTSSILTYFELIEVNYSVLLEKINTSLNQVLDEKINKESATAQLDKFIDENKPHSLGFIIGLIVGLRG